MDMRIVRAAGAALVAAPMLALLLGGAPALADDVDAADAAAPMVARISVLGGDVDVRRGDSDDAVAAAINAPLLAGDYLSTHTGGRAEVQFDEGNALRAGADSELRFAQIDATGHAVQLAQGTVELRVYRPTDAHPEIDTPSAIVRPQEIGRYRVTVTGDGDTLVTVRSGRADVGSAENLRSLGAGSTALLQGSASNPSFQFVNAGPPDDFDRWNDDRDRYVETAQSNQYVGEGIVGAGDLDRYGRWVYAAGYGNVWAPYAADGWAPYTAGRWVWEGYYGWTWVSDEPWGWAPYHYGRWFYNPGYGWCWYPERAHARPQWRPALVAFFSFGGGGGFSIGFGNVGWVPLAPAEPYHPWYGRRHVDSRTTIVNNTTIVNTTTTITNINVYKNVSAPGAVNGVSHHDFAGGQFQHIVRVSPVEMRGATPVHGVLPVVPNAGSLRFSDRPAVRGPNTAPAELRFRRFATPVKLVTPVRTFADQRTEAQAAAQREYPHATIETLHETQPATLKANSPPAAPAPSVSPQGSPARQRFDDERGTVKRGPQATPSPLRTWAPVHAETIQTPPVRVEPVHTPPVRVETIHTPAVRTETARPAQPVHPHGTATPEDHPAGAHAPHRRHEGGHAEPGASPEARRPADR
jgi:hypothetical protein